MDPYAIESVEEDAEPSDVYACRKLPDLPPEAYDSLGTRVWMTIKQAFKSLKHPRPVARRSVSLRELGLHNRGLYLFTVELLSPIFI